MTTDATTQAEPNGVQDTSTASNATNQVDNTTDQTDQDDVFDKPRAMDLINKQRAEIKELKQKANKLTEYEKAEQARKDAELSELQKAQAALDKANAELAAAKRKDMQRDIASKVGLPAVFATRLQGETPEVMEEDAKAILEALPKQDKTPNGQKQPIINPGNPPANPLEGFANMTDEQKRKWLNGG